MRSREETQRVALLEKQPRGGSLTRGGGQEEKMQVCGWREVREGEGMGDA